MKRRALLITNSNVIGVAATQAFCSRMICALFVVWIFFSAPLVYARQADTSTGSNEKIDEQLDRPLETNKQKDEGKEKAPGLFGLSFDDLLCLVLVMTTTVILAEHSTRASASRGIL